MGGFLAREGGGADDEEAPPPPRGPSKPPGMASVEASLAARLAERRCREAAVAAFELAAPREALRTQMPRSHTPWFEVIERSPELKGPVVACNSWLCRIAQL